MKTIDFSFAPLALRDQREGIGRKARRVRNTGRGVDDGAFGNDRDFLFTLRSSIVKIHLTLYHVHCLVAWVDVKLAAVFATAGDEDKRVGFLPKNAYPLAALGKPARFIEQTDDGHLQHKCLLRCRDWNRIAKTATCHFRRRSARIAEYGSGSWARECGACRPRLRYRLPEEAFFLCRYCRADRAHPILVALCRIVSARIPCGACVPCTRLP